MNPFLFSAVIILLFMCMMFLIAQFKKDNSLVDIGWGIGFILVAICTFIRYQSPVLSAKLVTVLTILWGLRLAGYITLRNWGKPEDFRYANWRKEWGKWVVIRAFFQVFMLQGFFMFINCLPIIITNSAPVLNEQLFFFIPIGIAFWVIGFFFETVGDAQMYLFKQNPAKGSIMNQGLWQYTRHPNYFGEALQWWGIFLIAIPSGYWHLSIISPITITFLLLKVSGVTMLEKKYEGDDAYSLYKRNTNSFFPGLPKRND